jgi:hypothetical protein
MSYCRLYFGGFSLVALLAIVALWVRSYFVTELVVWSRWADPLSPNGLVDVTDPDRQSAICSSEGRVEISSYRCFHQEAKQQMMEKRTAERARYVRREPPEHVRTDVRIAHFGFHGYDNRSPPGYDFDLVLHYWILALFAGLVPLVWLLRILRIARLQRRTSSGLCAQCRYDLRASKDRCPECGEPIPAPASKESNPHTA